MAEIARRSQRPSPRHRQSPKRYGNQTQGTFRCGVAVCVAVSPCVCARVAVWHVVSLTLPPATLQSLEEHVTKMQEQDGSGDMHPADRARQESYRVAQSVDNQLTQMQDSLADLVHLLNQEFDERQDDPVSHSSCCLRQRQRLRLHSQREWLGSCACAGGTSARHLGLAHDVHAENRERRGSVGGASRGGVRAVETRCACQRWRLYVVHVVSVFACHHQACGLMCVPYTVPRTARFQAQSHHRR